MRHNFLNRRDESPFALFGKAAVMSGLGSEDLLLSPVQYNEWTLIDAGQRAPERSIPATVGRLFDIFIPDSMQGQTPPVVMIGDSSVGKTSLVFQMCRGQ
jgi:hypothetical protein